MRAVGLLMLRLQFADGPIIAVPAKEIEDEINRRLKNSNNVPRAAWIIKMPESGIIIKGENMDLTLPAGKHVLIVGVQWTDSEGNVARVDGDKVEFTSSNPEFSAIEVDPGGSELPALKGHLVGVSQITGKADAIIGPGEKELIIAASVETVPGEAVAGKILFSEIKG